MSETADTRLKRLRIRSWRRGIREMDLALGGFADRRLAELGAEDLDLFEALLDENDHDIYAWIAGRVTPPARFEALLKEIGGGVILGLPR